MRSTACWVMTESASSRSSGATRRPGSGSIPTPGWATSTANGTRSAAKRSTRPSTPRSPPASPPAPRSSPPGNRAQLAAEALHALICGQRISKSETAAVGVLIDLRRHRRRRTLPAPKASDAPPKPTAASRYRWKPSAASPATPGSSPSSSTATANPSMWAGNAVSPPEPNAWRCEPNTPPAAWTKAATSPASCRAPTSSGGDGAGGESRQRERDSAGPSR